MNGDTVLHKDLIVKGDTFLHKTRISGDTILEDLEVNGDTVLHKDLIVQGTTNMDGQLIVSQDTLLESSLIVGKVEDMNGELIVNGNSSFKGNIDMFNNNISNINLLTANNINSDTTTSNNFIGNVTGTTTNINITDTNTNQTFYPTFVEDSGISKILRIDKGSWYMNPLTNDFTFGPTMNIEGTNENVNMNKKLTVVGDSTFNQKVCVGISPDDSPSSLFVQSGEPSAIFRMADTSQTSGFHFAFGWADNTKYHRIRTAGGSNNGFTMELIKSDVAQLWLPDYGWDVRTGGTARLMINMTGNIGIGTTSPTNLLDINSDTIRLRNKRTIINSNSNGIQGQICYDNDYMYVCISTNTWKRFALSSW